MFADLFDEGRHVVVASGVRDPPLVLISSGPYRELYVESEIVDCQ